MSRSTTRSKARNAEMDCGEETDNTPGRPRCVMFEILLESMDVAKRNAQLSGLWVIVGKDEALFCAGQEQEMRAWKMRSHGVMYSGRWAASIQNWGEFK